VPPDSDDRPRYDPSTAERFFPKGDFPQPEEVGGSWYDLKPPSGSVRPAEAAGEPEVGPAPGAGESGAQGDAEGTSGPDLARAVLDAALAKRRAAAGNPRRRTGAGADGTGKRPRGYSGPGPDPRDPQLFGAVLDRLMKARGWEKPRAEATVFGAWEKVVGPDIAKHSRPVKLDGGVLTVEAESTAWATQLRLLAATLLRSIAGEVGHNVVTKLNIHGPAAPSWAKGPRRVRGRGPRDTYG
jgi:predicted nucleic acid-binding Zn ribbon protein